MHGVSWGDVPTWVAVAVAAVGGAVALVQLHQQGQVIKGEIERNKRRDELLDGQLRELEQREDSRIREQAESVDVTWTDIDAEPGYSLVVVINGSRRPIRDVGCVAYLDEGPAGQQSRTAAPDYCAEMLPVDFPKAGGWVMPKMGENPVMSLEVLRPGGRAGFRFHVLSADCLKAGGEAEALFTDDAGARWSLSSYLSLGQTG